MSKSTRLVLPNIGNRTTLTAQEFKNLQNGVQIPAEKINSKFGAEKCEIEFIKKPKRKNEESQLQKRCVTWFRMQHPLKILFSIPNGGSRNKIEAVNLKAEGIIPGIADLQLLFGNSEYYSLFIEMKTAKGKQSEHQLAFEQYCNTHKYKYVVCRSLEEFIAEVEDYLKIENC